MVEVKINIERLHRKHIIKNIRNIMEDLDYSRSSDYMPLTGEKDILEYVRDDVKIIFIIDKRGESSQVLKIQGPSQDVDKMIFQLSRESTSHILRDILSPVISEENIDNLLNEIESSLKKIEK